MKVILTRDVARIGRKGTVCEVPDGHAFNFLIPRKLAIPATEGNMKRHVEEVKQHDMAKGKAEDMFRAACARLQNESVLIAAEANAQGHLFKGIHADDIAKQLTTMGIALDAALIKVEHPLKELGTHTLPLRMGKLEGMCTVTIVKK